jgi:repressor LexA
MNHVPSYPETVRLYTLNHPEMSQAHEPGPRNSHKCTLPGKTVRLISEYGVSYQLSILYDTGSLGHVAGGQRTTARRADSHIGIRVETGNPAIAVSTEEVACVPLLGRIAAGDPILAEESIGEVFLLPRQLVGEGALFLLKVHGDSMSGAAIADGDWAVVRQQPIAENGEIVAAIIGEEATVKKFTRSGNHVWLMPQNAAYTPIPGDEATILGKVVAVLRRS